MNTPTDVTRILNALKDGGAAGLDELYAAVYAELRRIASGRMLHERRDHTLQPTALVHEAFLRLAVQDTSWEGRAHFFGAAARAMRQILVDHSRGHLAQKRGGGERAQRAVALPEIESTPAVPLDEVLAIDEALGRLERFEPRKARVVELRYFGGLEIQEVADALGVSRQTVILDWAFARAWLFRELHPA